MTSGTGAGWDTYATADEYAPGKYFVTWEHDTSAIKVNRLDVSDAFTNTSTEFGTPAGWTPTPGSGTAEVTTAGELHLAAKDMTGASADRPYAPPGALVATVRGRVSDYSRLDPATGAGANLALSVHTGSRHLAFTVQEDGVHALRAGEPGWTRVLATPGDAAPHTWKAVVDAQGRPARAGCGCGAAPARPPTSGTARRNSATRPSTSGVRSPTPASSIRRRARAPRWASGSTRAPGG
ncbi:hypothetical protein [Streptomyces cyaneofuscatus]|uniref:hypothetical protein n=1 Tax=Streptomyces cyaneofuscatus TaxID=66883 RepID=UPI0037B9A8E8